MISRALRLIRRTSLLLQVNLGQKRFARSLESGCKLHSINHPRSKTPHVMPMSFIMWGLSPFAEDVEAEVAAFFLSELGPWDYEDLGDFGWVGDEFVECDVRVGDDGKDG